MVRALAPAAIVALVGCGPEAIASTPPSDPPATLVATVAPSDAPALSPSPTAAAADEPAGWLLTTTWEEELGTRVQLVTPSGTVQPIGSAATASWSADGSSVHLVILDEVCVPRLEDHAIGGSVGAVIGEGLVAGDSAFEWSPDGSAIAFLRYTHGEPEGACGSQGGTYPAEDLLEDLIVMRADGSDQRVVRSGIAAKRPLAWSPDGAAVAYSTNSTVEVVGLVDGAMTTFRGGSGVDLVEPDPPAWAPDGARLAVTYYRADGTRLALIDVASGSVMDAMQADAKEIAWSPFGVLGVTFEQVDPTGVTTGGDIALWDPAVGLAQPLGLTDVEAYSGVQWSPDGAWLAFTSSRSGVIGLVRSGGTGYRAIPGTERLDLLGWQPRP